MFKDVFGYLIGLACILGPTLADTKGERNYVMEFSKIVCNHNSSYIKALECSVRNESDHQTVLDGRIEFGRSFDDLTISIVIEINRKNMSRLKILDVCLNGCDFLNSAHKYRYVTVYVKVFKKYVNAIPQCPFPKNFNYTLRGFHFDLEDFPKYFPECEFKATHFGYRQNKLIFQVIVYGRFVSVK